MAHHPSELQIQAYLDGELAEESSLRVGRHLAECPSCHAMVEKWSRLRTVLRASRSAAEAFGSSGAFWVRLAGALPQNRPLVWPLLPYMPPLVLGMVGTFLQALLSLAIAAYALSGLGVIPSIGEAISENLPGILSYRFLEDSIYRWLGWSGREVVAYVMARWQGVGQGMQNGIALTLLVLILTLFSLVVVVLYFAWAMCWSAPARELRRR
ncbi:MAG: hypothetical protein A2Y73_07190 [Chloroflexi bacterium RBG_13_56_8]|nr:MAG: hypothetical protein A2Y73_07190 [Chloroflexi bacterium RBG_13_56_8]